VASGAVGEGAIAVRVVQRVPRQGWPKVMATGVRSGG
jgi:hypothetical protein